MAPFLVQEEWTFNAFRVFMTQIGLIPLLLVNVYIVFQESRKRLNAQNRKSKKEPKSEKWISFLTLMGGLIFCVGFLVSYLNGFCYFAEAVAIIIASLQYVLVAIYQLLRLYNMFADSPKYRYSISVFVSMGSVGAVLALYFAVHNCLIAGSIRSDCRLDTQYRFYFTAWYCVAQKVHVHFDGVWW